MAKLIVALLLLYSFSSTAEPLLPASAESGVTLLNSVPGHNQIPILDNRFRIDDGIDSITLVFFRRKGTASIVLVRPDGSKIFFNTAEQHNVRWHDADAYDLVEISNPMPGPWQAVGRILPESRILVLTELQLDVDPLPESIMEGESIKLTARLLDGDKPVNVREFNEILALRVLFNSSSNSNYASFGRGTVEAAIFRDDGRGYDEKARDGVFTGELNIRFGAGEWIPRYIVKTPLYTREVEQATMLIHPAPIKLIAKETKTLDVGHQIHFETVSELIDDSSVMLQGQVRYPDGETVGFSITDPAAPRELEMENRGSGSYILNVSVFGRLKTGREFVINLPEERYLVSIQTSEAPALAELPPDPAVVVAPEPEVSDFPWFWVILTNLSILFVGVLVIWLVFTGKGVFVRKKKAEAEKLQQTENTAPADAKKAQKNNGSDDILDLSLPDD